MCLTCHGCDSGWPSDHREKGWSWSLQYGFSAKGCSRWSRNWNSSTKSIDGKNIERRTYGHRKKESWIFKRIKAILYNVVKIIFTTFLKIELILTAGIPHPLKEPEPS